MLCATVLHISEVLLVSYLPHLFSPWRVCTRGACLSIERLSMSHASHACWESFLKSALKSKGPIFHQPYLLHLLLQFHLPPLCSAHMHQMVQHFTCRLLLCPIGPSSANILNCMTGHNSWWCLVVLLVTVLALWCHRTTGNKLNNLIELQSSCR